MSVTDPRKFRYLVEPIRQRQTWERDAQQARLAKVQRESNAAREQLEQMRGRLAEQAAHASSSWQDRPDPRAQRHVLAHLIQSQLLIQQADAAMQEIHGRLKAARQACEDRQRELEVTENHRAACLDIHIVKEQHAMAAQADDEWMTRSLWLDRGAGVTCLS